MGDATLAVVLALRLYGRDDDCVDDVIDGAAATQIIHGFAQPLQNRTNGNGPRLTLDRLVRIVAGVEVGKHKYRRVPCHRRTGHLERSHPGIDGRIVLDGPLQRQIRPHGACDTRRFPHLINFLAYRELTKLKSTYVDALPAMINPKTGRVHTDFNQAIAATGRLSSNNPNLQNIPIRTNRGKEIRKAFIPRDEDHVLLSCDYSQIELRIIAALSEDENMIEAFRNGLDIHTATAAKVFGVDLKAVTPDMRRNAKAVNFGIAYGQTAFGLSMGLGISRTEAQDIITNYQKQFPGVSRLMANNIQFAREHGYVKTIKGRKRWLRDINSANQTVRSQAERLAINSPIQGSAADMIKLAMISIYRVFQKEKFKTKMTLQVHDELVFDVYQPELDLVKEIVTEKMIHAIDMKVPIEVGAGVGRNWLDAH